MIYLKRKSKQEYKLVYSFLFFYTYKQYHIYFTLYIIPFCHIPAAKKEEYIIILYYNVYIIYFGVVLLKKKKGYSLALILIISGILLVLLTVAGTLMVSEAKQSIVQEKKTQAHYIARAGAAAAAKWITSMSPVELQNFNSLVFPVYSKPQSFNEGLFEISINKTPRQLLIESKGSVPNGKKSDGSVYYVTDTVNLVLGSKENNISQFDTVLFANSNIEISGGAKIKGNIGTNSYAAGAISIGSANINGIVYIPTGGDPGKIVSIPNWANKPVIKQFDNTRVYASPVLPQFPEDLPGRTGFILKGSNSKTINSNGCYSSITIEANTTLIIDTTTGDKIIRINEFNVKQGIIKINGTGKVKLYVDKLDSLKGSFNKNGNEGQLELYCNNAGSFSIDGGTAINGSLYFGETDLHISGGAAIKGDIVTAGSSVIINGGTYADPKVIYAPNANIYVSGGAKVDGAIIGKSISVAGGSTVTLDEPLIEVQLPIITDQSSDSGYKVDYWK